MNQIGPALALLAATGLAAAGVALAARSFNDPARRLRRGLRAILGRGPLAMLTVPERDRGLAFNFSAGRLAVVWDGGAWGLPYRFEDLEGAQLIVDGQIVGFAYRGDAGPPDGLDGAERHVALRLIFDDAAYPHFLLELWRRGDAGPPAEALAQAAGWLARIEDLLNRPPRSWWEAAPAPPPAHAKAPLEPEEWPSLGTTRAPWAEAPPGEADIDSPSRPAAGRG